MNYDSEDIVRGLVEVSVAINSLASEVASLRECIVANSSPRYDVKALEDNPFIRICPHCGEVLSREEKLCHKCGRLVVRSEEL